MKHNLPILFVICILSAFCSCFTLMPNTLGEFFAGFAVFALFFCGMLAPVFYWETEKINSDKFGNTK